MINIQERKKKREILTKEELAALKKYVHTFPTVVDAAAQIGIHRNVLDMVLLRGSGSPETIRSVKQTIAA